MKHIFILMALIGLLMLGGCRLDPNGLLGNDPMDKEEDVIESGDAYQLCREQNVKVRLVENAAGCATPSNLQDILRHFESGAEKTIRIEFDKMWDGTFPKLQRIGYRAHSYPYNNEKPRDLTCKIVESVAAVRAYECKLEGVPDSMKYQEYKFAVMELGHDTCKAKATYEATYLYDICNDPDTNYYTDLEVYFNRKLLPSLNPWVAPTP